MNFRRSLTLLLLSTLPATVGALTPLDYAQFNPIVAWGDTTPRTLYGYDYRHPFLFASDTSHSEFIVYRCDEDTQDLYEIAVLPTEHLLLEVRVAENLAVCRSAGFIDLFDISDPESPRIIGTIESDDEIRAFTIQGDRLYMTRGLDFQTTIYPIRAIPL